MSEDMSVTSLLNEDANTTASFIRTSAKISTEQTKLNAAFSSGSDSDFENTVQTMSNSQIVNELKMDALASTKTAQQIASDYNISIVRAQQILDELNESGEYASYNVNSELSNSYSYSVEYNTGDEYSTVSYTV